MKSLTELFNDKINGVVTMDDQDRREYLTEREGIRIYSAGQSEAEAMRGAQEDLTRLLKRGEK